MNYKIDLYDKKILYELDKKSNLSISNLAKKLRRSKQFILYRIKKLEDEGIISGYHAIVDMSKLGYFTFRVYIKFHKTTRTDEESFVKFIIKNLSRVWTITLMRGKWSYALFLGVQNVGQFHETWDAITLKYKDKIKSYNIAIYAPIYNFNRRFFLEEESDAIERDYGLGEKEEVTQKDREIIDIYASNVRMPYTEIAAKLGISPDNVRTRIKELERRKIIVGYKINLNIEKLGYIGYRVDLELNSTKKNKELLAYCRQHKSIYLVQKNIGGADFEMGVIAKDQANLLDIIDEMKKEFNTVIDDVEYFGYSTFHVSKYVPD